MLLYRAAAPEVIPYPVDYETGLDHKVSVLDFVPDAEALRLSQMAIREFYGLLFYKVKAAITVKKT
jgi:hypothetical protein